MSGEMLGPVQLLVCGFAFDAMASSTAAEFKPESSDGWAVAADERNVGRLPVLLVRTTSSLHDGSPGVTCFWISPS